MKSRTSRLIVIVFTILVASTIMAFGAPVGAPPEVQLAEARIVFPDEIVFALQATGDSEIEVVELEYGLDVQSCGTDINIAIPEDFEPDTTVDVSWTWDMHQTGSLPPGARLWWRWHLVDADGNETTTETQELTWLDDTYSWQTLEAEGIAMHWYEGDGDFGQLLLDTAVAAQTRLEQVVGTRPDSGTDLYIYGTTQEMRDAVLFEAQWTGGLAYYNHNVIIIGIAEDDLDWGLGTIGHELAHVIVHNVVSHCYAHLPVWLDEGLATWVEGELDDDMQQSLDDAIDGDTLFSVRSLTDSFTEQSERAGLSYAQSYSLVSYLIDTYGQAKLLALLETLQDGYRQDSALKQVYGLTIDELEAEWRAAVGAGPMTVSLDRADDTLPAVPTVLPLVGPPLAATTIPLPTNVSITPTPLPAGSPSTGSTLPGMASGVLVLAVLACCGLLGMAVILGAGIRVVRGRE